MYEILVYLANKDFESEVRNFSRTSGYSVSVASHLEQAVRSCAEEWFDLILVWPADYQGTAQFLASLNQRKLNFLPVVALIDNRGEFPKILTLEVTDYILLPLPRDEFYSIIQRIIEDLDLQSTVMEGMNWQGSLEEYNLIDLVQMIEESRNDAELMLSYGRKNATVYFKGGKPVHAQTSNDLTGEFALHKLIFWSKGNFQIRFSGRFLVRESIHSNNQEILLTLAHDLSEWDQFYRGMPDLFTEILVNPLVQSVDISPLQKEIIKECRNPVTIFDLLVSIKDENKVVIQEIKNLLESKLIGKRSDIENQMIRERQRKGLSQFINAFSDVFRKKQEPDEKQEDDEPLDREDFIPQIEFNRVRLKEEEKETIRRKIETLA